jgi:hypothetical protein
MTVATTKRRTAAGPSMVKKSFISSFSAPLPQRLHERQAVGLFLDLLN